MSIDPSKKIQVTNLLDPREKFLSLQAQILNSRQHPDTFEHAVWAAEIALLIRGLNNVRLFSDMCSRTNAQGDLKKTYTCFPNCPYIHNYPLYIAINKLAEKILTNSHPDEGTESPTLTESASPSRSSSPLPVEMKEEIEIDFSRLDLRE